MKEVTTYLLTWAKPGGDQEVICGVPKISLFATKGAITDDA
jgi:hypothetical protein